MAEFVWYASGSNDVTAISRYIPKYAQLVGGVQRALGAYGPRLFGPEGQLERIVSMLEGSSSTRQAVVQLFDRDDLMNQHEDVPCTCTLQFFVRGNSLEMHVHMRSNDALLGLPHDVFAFTMIQEWITARLMIRLGSYLHFVGSFHIYDTDIEQARGYLDEGLFEPIPMPEMPQAKPAEALAELVAVEAHIRAGDARCEQLSNGYWGDLARLLWLQLPNMPKVGASASSEPLRMRSQFFDIYISDQAIRAAKDGSR